MLNGFYSIWFLDCLNLIKYNGVDVFDSILDISSSTWMYYLGVIFITIIVLTAIKVILKDK